jgi:hypothetical protein
MQKIQKHIIAYWIKKSHILSTVFWKIIYIYTCIAPKKTSFWTYITEKTATRICFFQNASKKNKKHTQCRKTISWYYFFWTFLPFIYIFVIFTYRHTSFTFKRSNFTMLTPFQVPYHDQPNCILVVGLSKVPGSSGNPGRGHPRTDYRYTWNPVRTPYRQA